jgi:hypothetical protein
MVVQVDFQVLPCWLGVTQRSLSVESFEKVAKELPQRELLLLRFVEMSVLEVSLALAVLLALRSASSWHWLLLWVSSPASSDTMV